MAEAKRKSKAGAPRTEVFAMRLDPKLKYLAEIAARKQRRSLANFVEWAIEQALNEVRLDDPVYGGEGDTVSGLASKLWALDEPDRLIRLAESHPDLLSYDEQLIWRVVCDHTTYNKVTKRISRFKGGSDIDHSLVRDCWQEIKAYALGDGTRDALDEALCNNDSIPF
jgi:hypothetical protein